MQAAIVLTILFFCIRGMISLIAIIWASKKIKKLYRQNNPHVEKFLSLPIIAPIVTLLQRISQFLSSKLPKRG